MFNIIDNIGGGEQNLRREVAQRHMQHQRMVVKPRHVTDMWLGGDGGKHHQITRPDQPLSTVMHGDLAGGAGLLQIAGETRRTIRG